MDDLSAHNACHDLHKFELSDMIQLGTALRRVQAEFSSMEGIATAIVRFLYDHLADSQTGEKNCALVRFFKTHRFQDLPPDLQHFAKNAARGGSDVVANTRCLTLLATVGNRPQWNSRRQSASHQAIPLATEEVVRQAPMVAQLIQQIGLEIAQVVGTSPTLMIDSDQQNYNVFHVPDVLGSPYVPAQDFAREAGIRSVIGFGGVLPSLDLFAVIAFSRVYIPRETAEMFRTLALGIKLAVLPYARGPVFSEAA